MSNKEINRRQFIKMLGVGVVTLTAGPLLAACKSKPTKPTQEIIINPARTTEATRIPNTPIIKTSEIESNFTFKHLSKGDVFFAKPGDIVKGDLEANDNILYDQREDTGVITVLTNGGKVTAVNNGGDVIQPKPGADINKILAQLEQEMRANNPQIKTVRIQVFPGETQVQTEAVSTQTSRPTIETPNQDLGRSIGFNSNEAKTVSGRTVISGDVKINGEKRYDDNSETAFIVVVTDGSVTIDAPFGASGLTDFRSRTALDFKTNEIVRQKLTEFREVTIVEVQNGQIVSTRTAQR